MPTKTFAEFLYKGQPLDQEGPIPDDVAQCTTDMQKTGWVLKKLIASDYEKVQKILAEHQEVLRLVKIKKIKVNGEEQDVPWDLDTAVHATAFANQMFRGYEPAVPCTHCLDPNSSGPFATCVVPTPAEMEAVCDHDGEYGDYGLPFPLTDDMREALDNEDIERWMMLYEEALRTRNEN